MRLATEQFFNARSMVVYKMAKKKGRVIKSASPNHTLTYVVVAVVGIIIVASAGFYVYATSHSTISSTHSTTIQTTSSGVSTSGILYAVISTTQGTMEVELFQSLTPKTVDNFVSLADSGFYTDLVWHRIVQGFVIQTGDPTSKNGQGTPCSWGSTGSTQTVPLEIVSSLHNYEGYLGMARSSDPNSGSSQFYINLANNTSLDGQYTVFGKVISGLNVALAIGNLPVTNCQNGGTPPQNPTAAEVLSITIRTTP